MKEMTAKKTAQKMVSLSYLFVFELRGHAREVLFVSYVINGN